MTARQAATQRAMELQLPAFLAALAAAPDATITSRVRHGHCSLHFRHTAALGTHACVMLTAISSLGTHACVMTGRLLLRDAVSAASLVSLH